MTAPAPLKRCRRCDVDKPPAEFYRGRTCKVCNAARALAWNQAHPRRRRVTSRLSARRCRAARPELYRDHWRVYYWRHRDRLSNRPRKKESAHAA